MWAPDLSYLVRLGGREKTSAKTTGIEKQNKNKKFRAQTGLLASFRPIPRLRADASFCENLGSWR